MTPAEVKDWIELLKTNPLLVVVLVWGIVEVRRFLRSMETHLGNIEELLGALVQTGQALDERRHAIRRERDK